MTSLIASNFRWPSLDNKAATIDFTLLGLVFALMSFGIVMVLSASIDLAAHSYGDPWFFAKRH